MGLTIISIAVFKTSEYIILFSGISILHHK